MSLDQQPQKTSLSLVFEQKAKRNSFTMMRKRNTDERYKKLMAKKQLEREEAERARKQSEKKRLSSNRSVASNAEG